MAVFLDSVEQCVDQILAQVGKDLVVGAPLGLGKPVQLLNALYHRACNDPSISLRILTALSLERPEEGRDIEARLAGPIIERLFGDYESLAYMADLRANTLPPNITVSELYFKAGAMKGIASAQQNYISSNYTHIARDMVAAGMNVVLQLVAQDEHQRDKLSLSCNPDTASDVLDQLERERPGTFVAAAQVHPDLPFMGNDALVSADRFDVVVRNPDYDKALFAVPNAAVPERDYAAALHASSLIVDGGTLQIGIGSLGDAVAQACVLRHNDNNRYRDLLEALGNEAASSENGVSPFQKGLYASTEMFVYGMLVMMERGIIKRQVFDSLPLQQALNQGDISSRVDSRFYEWGLASGFIPPALDSASLTELKRWGVVPEGLSLSPTGKLGLGEQQLENRLDKPAVRDVLLSAVDCAELCGGAVLHGGFFLGPRVFYKRLREMPDDQRALINMTSVLRTNQLLQDAPLYTAQRQQARFINTGMMVTLSGAVTSDALEDGTVISGVGGQYNFVAMAHDLPGAKSILCIRATRGEGDELRSNIIPSYGHTTIPRHLRDIVVTEYGVADLRGQTDAEVIKRLLAVADARFQSELMEHAKSTGKLERDYTLPTRWANNTPAALAAALDDARSEGYLPDYPFGTELTEREQTLAASLRRIKALSDEPTKFVGSIFRALLHQADAGEAEPFLQRIQLEHPETTREFLIQQLLLLDLEERGVLQAV